MPRNVERALGGQQTIDQARRLWRNEKFPYINLFPFIFTPVFPGEGVREESLEQCDGIRKSSCKQIGPRPLGPVGGRDEKSCLSGLLLLPFAGSSLGSI